MVDPFRAGSAVSKPPLPIYARRLREARKTLGLSQQAIGEMAGIDPGGAGVRVNRYEQGVYEPSVQTAIHLARALGVPLAYIYAEDDQLAWMIRRFDRLTARQQTTVLKLLDKELPDRSRMDAPSTDAEFLTGALPSGVRS